MSDQIDVLQENSIVQERPFTSHAPLVGVVLVWLRTQWLNVAARWYIRPLIHQQNRLNCQLVDQMESLDRWLLHQDKTLVVQQRKTAVLTTHLTTLQHNIEAIEQRLTRQEQAK